MMEYTGLTDERNSWRKEIEKDFWNEPYVLQQYRQYRNSNLWRSTREVEKLCEYILYLESCIKAINKESYDNNDFKGT